MDLPITGIVRPATFDQAIAAYVAEPDLLPIAGGTDISVQLRAGKYRGRRLIDISGVVPSSISRIDQFVEIGAGASMDQIAASDAVRSVCPALSEAAKLVGAWPIQCRATIGGNLANASPAADTAPPLLVSGALVVAANLKGRRTIDVDEFFSGPGSTTLRPGELIHSILIPSASQSSFGRFTKLGWQREQIISVVSLAVNLHLDDQGVMTRGTVAFGSVAPTPIRSSKVEAILVDSRLDSLTRKMAVEAVQEDIAPIDDVRAPGWYRRVAAATLLDRMLEEATSA